MRASAFSFLIDGAAAEAHADVAVDADTALLMRALSEGARGVGRTAPNPAVGAAVRLADGAVVVGHHARAGERHAEVVALDLVQGRAKGSVLACTLEPCVHHGKTPPCVDRILAEGVSRVIIGALDENPVVRGKGVQALRAGGVEVQLAVGALQARAVALAAPFFSAIARKRPWVVLKIAVSLDGRVATASGASRWITGPRSRAIVHALRDRCDAVLVGAGTVLQDDPALTVRDVEGRDPARIILDRTLSVPASARALNGGAVVVTSHSAGARADALRARGAALVTVPEQDGHLALDAALEALCTRGLHSVLVEAGPGLATALLRARLVDELWWFQAPMVLGADAVAAFGGLSLAQPADAARLEVLHRASFEGDSLTVLAPAVSSAITPAQ